MELQLWQVLGVFHKLVTCQWNKKLLSNFLQDTTCHTNTYHLHHQKNDTNTKHNGLENAYPFKSGYFGYLISILNFSVLLMTCVEHSILTISTCIVVRLRALGVICTVWFWTRFGSFIRCCCVTSYLHRTCNLYILWLTSTSNPNV